MAQSNDWLTPVCAFVASQEQLANSRGEILVVFDVNNLAISQRFSARKLFAKSVAIKQLCTQNSPIAIAYTDREDSVAASTSSFADDDAPTSIAQVQYVLYIVHGSIDTAPAWSGDTLCPYRGPRMCNAQQLLSYRTGQAASELSRDETPAAKLASLLGGELQDTTAQQSVEAEAPAHPVLDAVAGHEAVIRTKTLWVRAYQMCLRTMVSSCASELPLTDVELIDATVQVAQYLSAVASIQTPINSIVFQGALWGFICATPGHWARIGLILKHEPIFVEAMTHLIGKGSKGCEKFVHDHLPPNVAELAHRKTRELCAKWSAFKCELLSLTPKARATAEACRVKGTAPIAMEHHVYRIAREWFIAHFTYLTTNGNHTNVGPETELCDHQSADCYCYAGLVRLLTVNQRAYLRLSDMRELLRPGAKERGMDKQLQKSLVELKMRVTRCAKSLKSTLKLNPNHEKNLRYLTCIKFGPRDIPWFSLDDVTTSGQAHTRATNHGRMMGLIDEGPMLEDEPSHLSGNSDEASDAT